MVGTCGGELILGVLMGGVCVGWVCVCGLCWINRGYWDQKAPHGLRPVLHQLQSKATLEPRNKQCLRTSPKRSIVFYCANQMIINIQVRKIINFPVSENRLTLIMALADSHAVVFVFPKHAWAFVITLACILN